MHRSPGIYLTAEENPRKPQLGDRVTKGCATSHHLKWGPFPPNEVDRIAQRVRKEKGGKGRKYGEGFGIDMLFSFTMHIIHITTKTIKLYLIIHSEKYSYTSTLNNKVSNFLLIKIGNGLANHI